MSNRLSRSQVLLIGCAFVLDSTLISKPSLVLRDLQSDFWIGFAISGMYGLAAILLYSVLASRFPRRDLFDGLIAASPRFGRFVVGVYTFFFLAILLRDMRATTDFVKITLLPVTPLPVIAVLLGLCVYAIARHGKLVVGRMSQLWQPMLILLILCLPIFLSSAIVFENLLPLFRHSPRDVWIGSSHLTSYAGEAIGIFMIATYRSWTMRYSIYSFLLGWFLLLLLTMTVVLSMGIELPVRTLYPNYMMIRKVRLTDFLDRLDLPMVGVWLPAMMVKTSFGLYIAANGFARIFPKLRLSTLTAIISAAAVIAPLTLFQNAMQIMTYDRWLSPAATVVQLALPALLLLVFRKRKKPPADWPAEVDSTESY